jgi:hypothetical protein
VVVDPFCVDVHFVVGVLEGVFAEFSVGDSHE